MAIDFNSVLNTFQEFGPNRAIPIEQRWREQFPQSSDAELRQWAARCKEIEDYAYDRAVEVLDRTRTEPAAAALIAKKFPELSQESVSRVFSQALYFASK